MDRLIQLIIALSGPMPDPEAHGRYLRTLSLADLQARAQALRQEAERAGELPSQPLLEFA
jgi:hypothetical protein